MATVTLSENQKKVKNHIINIRQKIKQNFQVLSVAGSGKSWTLRYLVKVIRKYWSGETVMILQFNKHIADAMKSHFVGYDDVTVLTSHSAGLAVLRKNGMSPKGKISDYKYFSICKELIDSRFAEFCDEPEFQLTEGKEKKESKVKKINKLASELNEIVMMAMMTLCEMDYGAISAMCDKHAIMVKNPKLIGLVNDVIDTGVAMARNGTISFSDMIFIPIHLKLKFPKYDWVLCDEAQDFNAAQLELVCSHVKKGGRIGAFGDEKQSIMAWAGAMTDSMEQFRMKVNARQMPLSICYRCPSKVLDLARILVPSIQDRPDCPEGNVECIPSSQIISKARAGDYILCRLNAPLVSLCIEFIKRNIRAKVKGRDIASKIIKEYDNIIEEYDNVKTVDEFIGALTEYAEREVTRAGIKKVSQSKMQMISDTFAALKAIAIYKSSMQKGNTFPCSVVKDQINYIFDEDIKDGFIILSSIHKAKGLESDNVFIIDFDKMPFKPGKDTAFRKEDYEQEVNILYVSLTRPKQNLYIQGLGMEKIEDVIDKLKSVKQTLDNYNTSDIVEDEDYSVN